MKVASVIVLLVALFLGGCNQYVTPGGGVNLVEASDTLMGAHSSRDAATIKYLEGESEYENLDILEAFERKPAARFPANIAFIRVQEAGYRAYGYNESYGTGKFSVVTSKLIEKDEHFERLVAMPQIAGVAPVNRMILPEQLHSVTDLREAVAQLRADILVVYTLDTSFNIEGTDLGPLSVITLGFLPTEEAYVSTTASAAFFDVRTGFVYGLSEATARKYETASYWTTEETIDETRVLTEAEAFDKLVDELEQTWINIIRQYAVGTRVSLSNETYH